MKTRQMGFGNNDSKKRMPMSALSNVQYERFCHLIAKGGDRLEAFHAAGFKGQHRSGPCRLLKLPGIKARLAELKPMALGSFSRPQITERLSQIAERAEGLQSAAALAVARAALMDIARLNGLAGPEETEAVETRTMVLADRPLSEDEWQNLHPLSD